MNGGMFTLGRQFKDMMAIKNGRRSPQSDCYTVTVILIKIYYLLLHFVEFIETVVWFRSLVCGEIYLTESFLDKCVGKTMEYKLGFSFKELKAMSSLVVNSLFHK